MVPYANRSGQAGITAYETGTDWVKLEFQDGSQYLYTYQSNGREVIEAIKQCATAGLGLTTYVNQHTQGRYAKKLGGDR